jgi:hypothetical protein
MDPVPVIVVVAILAVVVIASFMVFRQRSKVKITGPFNTGVDIDASNDPLTPTPGIKIGTALSHEGSTITEDQTGRGIDAQRLEAKQDVRTILSSTEKDSHPKA